MEQIEVRHVETYADCQMADALAAVTILDEYPAVQENDPFNRYYLALLDEEPAAVGLAYYHREHHGHNLSIVHLAVRSIFEETNVRAELLRGICRDGAHLGVAYIAATPKKSDRNLFETAGFTKDTGDDRRNLGNIVMRKELGGKHGK